WGVADGNAVVRAPADGGGGIEGGAVAEQVHDRDRPVAQSGLEEGVLGRGGFPPGDERARARGRHARGGSEDVAAHARARRELADDAPAGETVGERAPDGERDGREGMRAAVVGPGPRLEDGGRGRGRLGIVEGGPEENGTFDEV